ncbi:hypothetical protein GGI20_002863 [Coemansia sp. BCRC 34301]|nr:hypothetical protein GGI20_002863 [Coemansia sp. BCRC 34301]
MQLITKNTATAALVAVQYFALASAMPDNDLRAGSPQIIDWTCPNAQGKLMCVGTSALLVCDHSYWRFLSFCPEGTKCQNNQCINAADFTTVASRPVSPPVAPPTPASRTTSNTVRPTLPATNPSNTPIKPTTSPTSNGGQTASIPNITQVSKLPIASTTPSKTSGTIPNITEVPKLPITSATKSKTTGTIPNIITVPELPISDTETDTDTLSSGAAGQPSWTRLHMFIPVVSAIVAPCIAMLLF